ncbi:MAG: preprotein translocase subunit SecY [Planctomycetota bacterium]
MKFIETLKNIYKIEELRNKIGYTLLLIFVYRFASYIVLPGVNPLELDSLTSNANGGILGLINIFAGGAFSRASIMALGIMPYISASIAIQLLTVAVPYFQKLQKEGESGRRQMNQITRYLTIVVTMFQGFAYITYLKSIGLNPVIGSVLFFQITTMIILTAGTLFAMWIGEKITDNGIGQGISLLIMVGIMANLPGSILNEITSKFGGSGAGGGMVFILEIAILFVIVMATIALVQAVRRIPVQYAKRNIVKDGRISQAGGVRQYLPLKVNASGVMPIIFAQALMFLPAYVVGLFNTGAQNNEFLISISDPRRFGYNLLSFLLVVVFTYLYTAMIINPKQIGDQLKKEGGFIPGVKPGIQTTEYIDSVVSRITLPGSIFLGLIAILPAFALMAGINQGFAYFFGGTSLLIMVAVILDTLQQVESYLLNRHYDGLTKSGRIKGRHSVGAAI